MEQVQQDEDQEQEEEWDIVLRVVEEEI